MITFEHGGRRFNYRVVGVVYGGDKVLIHRPEIDDFWTLPGGRCEMLESAADSLKREMSEELGVEVNVVRLLWLVEDFFEHLGVRYHELALYFLMTFPEDSPLYGKTEQFFGDEEGIKLIFEWHPVHDLKSVELLPAFLRTALKSPPESAQHVVIREF